MVIQKYNFYYKCKTVYENLTARALNFVSEYVKH
jgi:hypothetical protein